MEIPTTDAHLTIIETEELKNRKEDSEGYLGQS